MLLSEILFRIDFEELARKGRRKNEEVWLLKFIH